MKKLAEITKLSEFMEMLEWCLDENGMVIVDYVQLTEAVFNRFPELEDDMQDDDLPFQTCGVENF